MIDYYWCLTARQHIKDTERSICAMCQLRGGKPAQAANDGQPDAMHILTLHNNHVTQLIFV